MPAVVGVNTAAGSTVLLNCEVEVFGEPARIDHTGVPMAGALAASVAVAVLQMDWLGPAFEVVGEAVTVITTSSCEEGHDVVLVVQRRV